MPPARTSAGVAREVGGIGGVVVAPSAVQFIIMAVLLLPVSNIGDEAAIQHYYKYSNTQYKPGGTAAG